MTATLLIGREGINSVDDLDKALLTISDTIAKLAAKIHNSEKPEYFRSYVFTFMNGLRVKAVSWDTETMKLSDTFINDGFKEVCLFGSDHFTVELKNDSLNNVLKKMTSDIQIINGSDFQYRVVDNIGDYVQLEYDAKLIIHRLPLDNSKKKEVDRTCLDSKIDTYFSDFGKEIGIKIKC